MPSIIVGMSLEDLMTTFTGKLTYESATDPGKLDRKEAAIKGAATATPRRGFGRRTTALRDGQDEGEVDVL